MILLADATKIKCNFVSETIKFLKRRKYSVSVCQEDIYTFYADTLKLLYKNEVLMPSYLEEDHLVSECLDQATECDLVTKANKYSELTLSCLDGVLCANQVAITLTSASKTCSGLVETYNPTCGCKYPNVILNNNSTDVTGIIPIRTTFSGTCANPAVVTTENLENDNSSYYSFGFNSDSTSLVTSESFITLMRVYDTDGYGTLTNKYDLNLNPSTSPYMDDDPVTCPGCSAILPDELKFGNANFENAFATLMDNVSLALFGITGLHHMSAWWNGSNYRVRCRAVHNPSGNHIFGINRNDSKLVVSTPSGPYTQPVNAFGDNDAAPYHAPLVFNSNFGLVEAPGTLYSCADLEPLMSNQVSYPNYNTLQSNMNKIVLNSSIGMTGYPIEVDTDASSSCSSTILSATYTTDLPVDSVE